MPDTDGDLQHRQLMDTDAYLDRIGIDPAEVRERGSGLTAETVARLQRAHVTSVPFETLAVTGDPHGLDTPGVPSIDPADTVPKIVERGRGGWCFELNGAFATLLRDLGVPLDVLAARVVGADGPRPPANHRISLVHLDEPSVVDVGTGAPMVRRPLPLDGTAVTDGTGHTWQVAESERPDADYVTRYRAPGAETWTDRYVFRRDPRDRSFFAATCEYLATAPESHFTDGPSLAIGTDAGHLTMDTDSMERLEGGEVVTERPVTAETWHDLLATHFGIDLETD